jgi:manganese transport protein
MEGFLRLKMKAWKRRLLTRGIAIIPAIVVAVVMGDSAVGRLLIVSQVILSVQLSFAVFPLVHFTSSRKYVGEHVNNWVTRVIAGMLAIVIAGLNVYLLVSIILNKELVA